jgi:hypothetical protein
LVIDMVGSPGRSIIINFGLRGRFVLALIVATAVSWTTFFFFRDNFSTHYPVKVLSAQAFRAFEIPYWNFADDGGQPLAGNPNTLTFYPDNILYLFLPAHVAFNLHFWLHLLVALFAMRAVTRSWFGGLMWAMGGVAVSATAFYNLIVAIAMIPLAFLAVQRRSAALLGIAFGLLILAGEPLTILAAALAVAILALGRMSVVRLAGAVGIAALIASPLLIAYGEIANEVERSVPMSARTVLNASLHPMRLVEMFVWPILGFLNDAGTENRERLFSTIFVGIIAIPALFRRSRYVAVVLLMLVLALGRFNPLMSAAVEQFEWLRIVRYPEKFVLPAAAALVVLSADWFRRTRGKAIWIALTFVPLGFVAIRAMPIDRFAPYHVAATAPRRVHVESEIVAGIVPAREEYRLRARNLEPLFGAVAGLEYVVNPSPDGMHALRSRMINERIRVVPPEVKAKYLRQRLGPPAQFAGPVAVANDIYREAGAIEHTSLDDTMVASAPVPSGRGSVTAYRRRGQTIEIDVKADSRALLVVNQTWFRAWRAVAREQELATLPVNVDRLGVVVPAGTSRITLRFGRRRAAVAAAWIVSTLVLLVALLVQKRDRRAGEVERSADENGALV